MTRQGETSPSTSSDPEDMNRINELLLALAVSVEMNGQVLLSGNHVTRLIGLPKQEAGMRDDIPAIAAKLRQLGATAASASISKG
ncbi:hypothetical protein KW794_03715 [Candidatus Saccharibacteria bacterium]|nr:hypothetical protein [Candidatus Saccharibacteria bacterium]